LLLPTCAEAESADRLLWVEGGRLLGDARRGTADFDKLLARLRDDAATPAAHAMAIGF
jgi:ATP-binding cassette subfamily C protein CydC